MQIRRSSVISVFALLAYASVASSCGPEDYQKPIQQFQDASAVMVAAVNSILSSVNTTEENAQIEALAFEHKSIDPRALQESDLLTPEEVSIRVKALDTLTQYTTSLGSLASGKQVSSIGDATQSLSKALSQLSTDAGGLPASKGTLVSNKNFSGAVGAAAAVVGGIAQLVAQHKARAEIKRAIRDGDSSITALMDLINNYLQAAYARQRATLQAQGVYLFNAYKSELSRNGASPDPYILMTVAKEIEAYRQRENTLRAADPTKPLNAMKATHTALVAYISSDNSPKTLADLFKAGQEFANAAKPFGEAAQALWKMF